MRIFSKFDKGFTKEIIKDECFGKQIIDLDTVKNLFDDVVLLILNSKLYIFYNTDNKLYETQSQLISLMSLLRDLESESLVVCSDGQSDYLVIYNHKVFHCGLSQNGILSFGKYKVLLDRMLVSDTFDNVLFSKGKQMEGAVEGILSRYFISNIYATDTIKNLANNKFKSLEQRSLDLAKKSLKYSVCILIVSLIWSVFMTFFNNKHAVTELKKEQYSPLLSNSNKSVASLDSIVNTLERVASRNCSVNNAIFSLQKENQILRDELTIIKRKLKALLQNEKQSQDK